MCVCACVRVLCAIGSSLINLERRQLQLPTTDYFQFSFSKLAEIEYSRSVSEVQGGIWTRLRKGSNSLRLQVRGDPELGLSKRTQHLLPIYCMLYRMDADAE